MKVHPSLEHRLNRAIAALGTHEDTWVQGDPPLNNAVDEARTALYKARDVIRLRQLQHDEHMAKLARKAT